MSAKHHVSAIARTMGEACKVSPLTLYGWVGSTAYRVTFVTGDVTGWVNSALQTVIDIPADARFSTCAAVERNAAMFRTATVHAVPASMAGAPRFDGIADVLANHPNIIALSEERRGELVKAINEHYAK